MLLYAASHRTLWVSERRATLRVQLDAGRENGGPGVQDQDRRAVPPRRLSDERVRSLVAGPSAVYDGDNGRELHQLGHQVLVDQAALPSALPHRGSPPFPGCPAHLRR